jgi:hypothetical protein
MFSHKQRLSSVLILVACLAACGTRPAPLPATYAVHGRVTYRDGTPFQGGLVQFMPQADHSVTTNATICPDGTYRLTTMRDGLRADGAVAGPSRVMVISPPSASVERRNVAPTIYPTPYDVKPRDNEFNLTVERP